MYHVLIQVTVGLCILVCMLAVSDLTKLIIILNTAVLYYILCFVRDCS